MEIDATDEIQSKSADMPQDQKRVSLESLLALMRAADEYADECELDLASLGDDLRSKVDRIVEYIDYCNARADAIKPRAEKLAKKAAAYSKRAKDLSEYVAKCMHADAMAQGAAFGDKQRLPGDEYEIELYYTERTEFKREPDAMLYRKLGEYMRRYYEWDARAVKAALKEGRDEIAEHAIIRKKPHVRIRMKH